MDRIQSQPRPHRRPKAHRALAFTLALLLAGPWAASAADDLPDLTQLSIEDLMEIEITSVSRRPESLSDAAAAVFVLTSEDIRRSGATSIPDALRMVPGLQVARIDANKWAVTSRGFSGRFANKLLVQFDGRTVYTPLFSGVYWDVQDTLLEDVERIEVIRGPGATLWGGNAVNGIINIITRPADDTQGALAVAGAGSEERGFVGARYGGAVGDIGHYRVYAKHFSRDGALNADGDDTGDDWRAQRGGFRIDAHPGAADRLTLQGDVYRGRAGTLSFEPSALPPYSIRQDDDITFSGGNLLGRLTRDLSDQAGLTVQGYYDRTTRTEQALVAETRHTFDLDVQNHFTLGQTHNLVWGFGVRLTRDHLTTVGAASTAPPKRLDQLFSAFLQDDIDLTPDTLRLTIGSKIEHNDYTGFELQPNLRLRWSPHPRHTLWGSVSRAVRTPSRGEADGHIKTLAEPPGTTDNPSPLPAIFVLTGNENLNAENLLAWELGYRVLLHDNLSLDLAGFLNRYDNLRATETGTPAPVLTPDGVLYVELPLLFNNELRGRAYGLEAAVDWDVLEWWRLQAAYSYFDLDLEATMDARATQMEAARLEGSSPKHQISLRSSTDLPAGLELDLWLRYVDDLPSLDVDSYTTLDVRLGWTVSETLELSVVGQNLLEEHHLESVTEGAVGAVSTEVQRGVYGKVAWRF